MRPEHSATAKAQRSPHKSRPAQKRSQKFEAAQGPRLLFGIAAVTLAAALIHDLGNTPLKELIKRSLTEPAERVIEQGARVLEQGPEVLIAPGFEPLSGVYPDAMDVDLGPDQAVWIISKYNVYRISPTGESRLILDASGYRAAMRGDKMSALSAGLPVGPDEAWFGSWYGEVLHWKNGRLTRFSEREKPPQGRIHDLLVSDGDLRVATSAGLWRLKGRQFNRATHFKGIEVVALSQTANGPLFAATQDAVHRRHPGAWLPIWQADASTEITALESDGVGGLLVGTRHGAVHIDAHGSELERMLADTWVTGFAGDAQTELWVGTWTTGLRMRSAGQWSGYQRSDGLAADSISDLALGADGRLWLSIYGDGARSADLATARSLLTPVIRP